MLVDSNKARQRSGSFVLSLTLCALFTALLAVGAQLSIPLPLDMRLTLQMPLVLLCGVVLGSKRAAVSTSAYLLAGLTGLPVFTNFSGGIAYVIKPTFGFIVSFIPAAFVIGLICEKAKKTSPLICFAAVSAGFVLIYVIGVLYHFFALMFWMNAPKGFLTLFLGAGYTLTLPKDFAAAILVSLIGARIAKLK